MQRDSLMTETLIDVLERVPVLPLIALCFANAAEAVEVLGAGYVLARVTTNKTERSLIAGGVYLGMLIGGLISGLVADRRGRSIVLNFALTLATLASVAARQPNIVLLIIAGWLLELAWSATLLYSPLLRNSHHWVAAQWPSAQSHLFGWSVRYSPPVQRTCSLATPRTNS